MAMPACDQLEQLREKVRGIERQGVAGREVAVVQAPWGALPCGRLHEWLGVEGQAGADWAPPLCVMADLCGRTVQAVGGWTFWIGPAVWPHPAILTTPGPASSFRGGCPPALRPALIDRTLTVAATRPADILWAADLVARSPATAAVVLDASALDMPATRRLQLAAEAGGALVLACRPAAHAGRVSAAACRWRIDRCRDPADAPRWTVSLLRCKDASLVASARTADCVLEWNHATRSVSCPAAVADRPRQAGRRTA
jgi:protein ImuA